MTATDYNRVDIDDDKDPTEYHYTERRAEILDFIEQAGSPKRLNTAQLAERYGVTDSQIYQDYDRLAEFVSEVLGERAELRTQALYERTVNKLLSEGDVEGAWRVTMEWNDWLVDRGALDKTPEKLEAEVTEREARNESESYVIEEDDGEPIEALPDGETESG